MDIMIDNIALANRKVSRNFVDEIDVILIKASTLFPCKSNLIPEQSFCCQRVKQLLRRMDFQDYAFTVSHLLLVAGLLWISNSLTRKSLRSQ